MRICERFQKIWLLVGVMGLICVLFTIFYDINLDTWRLERFKFSYKPKYLSWRFNQTTKKILFWNTMFGDATFYFGKGDVFKDCSNVSKNCWATHDRSIINVEEFDAILFHANEVDLRDMPTDRQHNQIYVFVNLESPTYRPLSCQPLENDFFNATMTYRLDSDIVWPYANVRKISDNSVVAPRLQTVWNARLDELTDRKSTKKSTRAESELIKSRRKKSKTAVWFVSNCSSKSKREEYVRELSRYVDVDIYGKCGQEIRCPTGQDCFREVVEPDYYFYLSFENSLCQDYVTEKLWNALQHDVVPIVYGGANYTLMAPPKSYINVFDFDDPKALAKYLKKLIAEPSEYDKYFEWKKIYKVVDAKPHVMCQLCQYLHDNTKEKSYSPLSAWYQTDKCPFQEKLERALFDN